MHRHQEHEGLGPMKTTFSMAGLNSSLIAAWERNQLTTGCVSSIPFPGVSGHLLLLYRIVTFVPRALHGCDGVMGTEANHFDDALWMYILHCFLNIKEKF